MLNPIVGTIVGPRGPDCLLRSEGIYALSRIDKGGVAGAGAGVDINLFATRIWMLLSC